MPADSDPGQPAGTTGFAAFRHLDFVYVFSARVLNGLATNMLRVAIGWEVWALTEDPMMLAYVGLAAFLPNPLFFLAAGVTADRFPRHIVLATAYGVHFVAGLALFANFASDTPSIPLTLATLFVIGAARMFSQPASHGLVPNTVPPESFPNAIAWGNLGQQFATIIGPALGGLLLTAGSTTVFLTVAVFYAVTSVMMLLIRSRSQKIDREPVRLATVFAGLGYIWLRKIILGAISLDLFAVLLGGARALMPIYADVILHTDEIGLGLLNSSVAVGAMCSGLVLTRVPVRRRAGRILLGAVSTFGVATVVFGLSHAMWLSLIALAIAGGADTVSVFIRQTLVQVATPDDMRGRVTAVNTMFVSASNELGEFESGVVAALISPVGAAVIGGVGTVMVALLWARLFPTLRDVDSLDRESLLRVADAELGKPQPAAG